MRASVRDISAAAVEQDFLVKDPARKVTVPSQLCDMDKTILTWEQLPEHTFGPGVAGSDSSAARHDECPFSSELFALC
jgi:hypothetical protein